MSEKSKIYIFYHGRFPSEKAAALFVAKTAESFAKLDYEVEMIVPKRKSVTYNPFTYYNIKQNFKVTYLNSIDLINFRPAMGLGFKISHISFALALRKYLKNKITDKDILYSNESISYLFVPKTKTMCYELHDFPEKHFWFYRNIFNRVTSILVTNKWKEIELHNKFTATKTKTFVELNAVDVSEFNLNLSKKEARAKLSLPQDKKIVLYTGHLYSWKGVGTLIDAIEYMENSVQVYIVGGTDKDIQAFRERYSDKNNLNIIGHRPHQEMPIWQKAADVLVIPNTAKEKISKYYTSPMKLFEYLTSGRPIIASNIPSIKEIYASVPVYFFNPDDAVSLAESVCKVLDVEINDDNKAVVKRFIESHSWLNRAKRIESLVIK